MKPFGYATLHIPKPPTSFPNGDFLTRKNSTSQDILAIGSWDYGIQSNLLMDRLEKPGLEPKPFPLNDTYIILIRVRLEA